MKIFKETPFEFGHLACRVRPPEDALTVAVKATFEIVPEALCRIADEQTPFAGDEHYDDDEGRSIRYDADLALYKPRADVTLVGTCHPPGGSAETSAVYFRLGRVERTLAVFGERKWERSALGARPSAPAAFSAMPLAWEKSFGGPGFAANPVGAGAAEVRAPDGSTTRPLPNIEDPRALIRAPGDRPAPAGTFPVPRNWPARVTRVGTCDQRWRKTRWPDYPEDFDWGYFNAAPPEQQAEGYLRGDEEIELRNLHPQHALIRTRLPGLRARCFVERQRGDEIEFFELPLALDTAHVDADAMRVYCVWRGLLGVSSPEAPEIGRLLFTHDALGQERPAESLRAVLAQRVAEAEAEERGFAPEAPPTGPESMPTGASVALPEAPAVAPPVAPAIAAAATGAALVAAALVPEGGASAERAPGVAERLARGESLAGADLSGADLSGLDLRGAALGEVILRGATLRGSVLRDAVLDGAVLEGAVLDGADLSGASLRGADLSGAKMTGVKLTDAKLDDAVLEGAVLDGADLSGASLLRCEAAGASLLRGDLSRARLDRADFSRARMDEATLREASLHDTTVEGASLERAVFDGADVTLLRAGDGARLVGASFRGARAAGARFPHAVLEGTDFNAADLAGADFTGASLPRARLDGCALRGARFARASMPGASLLAADALGARFESADLAGADLRGANLFGANLLGARVEGARLELANIERTALETA